MMRKKYIKKGKNDFTMLRPTVPLDEMYSYDYALFNGKNGISDTETDTIDTNRDTISGTIGTNKDTIPDISELEMSLLSWIRQNASCTQKDYADKLAVSLTTVKRLFAKLQKNNVLVREGTNRKGYWKIIEK